MDEKKEKEKTILKKIYNDKNKKQYALIDDTSERPDFIMKDLNNNELFGVEITNMYYDQFSARLKEIPNCVEDMLKNGIPRKAQGILNERELLNIVGLIDALIRLIAFKCKSERIYIIRDFFD